MPKRRQQRQPQDQRPERTGPAAELYSADGLRYHGQNSTVQNDMAQLAVALCALQGTANMLADVGCGSGLSCAALSPLAGAAWVGTDVTREMLLIAASQPGCRGHFALGDFGQGLPLRPGCLDGAISVSAVQWLCSAPDPPAVLARFFGALRASLARGAIAALQVYPEDDSQAQQLVAGALRSGLDGDFFVSFPHSTPAKKYYVLAQRPPGGQDQQQQQQQQQQGRLLAPQRCCNLAFPRAGSCILSWVQHLRQQQRPATALLPHAERLQQEHGRAGKQMQRLLRRAEALAAESCGGGSGSGDGRGDAAPAGAAGNTSADGNSGSSSSEVLQAELQMLQRELMPCGGAIFVQLIAAASLLAPPDGTAGGSGTLPVHAPVVREAVGCPCSGQLAEGAALPAIGSKEEAGVETAAPAADAADYQQFAAAAVAVAQQLLAGPAPADDSSSTQGGSSSSSCAALCAVVKAATADIAALHARKQPMQPFPGPPAAGTGSKKQQFMRLEALEVTGQQQPQQGQPHKRRWGQWPVAAVLHAHKMSQHLALRFSCAVLRQYGRSSSQDNARGSTCSHCGTSSSEAWGSGDACCTCIARCVQRFCEEQGACVVALDAHLHADRLDATWLLFVGGLQHLDRSALRSSIARHFD